MLYRCCFLIKLRSPSGKTSLWVFPSDHQIITFLFNVLCFKDLLHQYVTLKIVSFSGNTYTYLLIFNNTSTKSGFILHTIRELVKTRICWFLTLILSCITVQCKQNVYRKSVLTEIQILVFR